MTLKADAIMDTIPATTEISIDRVRLVSIDIHIHPNRPYSVSIGWLSGYVDAGGVFIPVGREEYSTSDMAIIGALMAAPTLTGELMADAIERVAFDMLQSVGVVPAGSIEV